MSHPIATYSFLPWLRQGIAGYITSADMDTAVKVRAGVRIELKLSGEPVSAGAPLEQTLQRDVQLYGPGDIVGIDARAIIRIEPRDWITNFEPNYLAHIEFYNEELPWRYTPAAPDGSGLRLRPWIALVVLEEGEFEDGKNIAGKPLPYIVVNDLNKFPPADQLWAWAHVHVNRSLAGSDAEFVSTDMDAVLPRFQSALDLNADIAYSRIVCPRKLDENNAYHAFLMPVFETGRLAGLGLDPSVSPHATFSAWSAYAGRPDTSEFPVYYRWFFRTGTQGDFEYLVRLLQPKPVDKRVGTRNMDVQDPGANLPGITDPDLGGILKLGGALRIPRSSLNRDELADVLKYENWALPYPHPFQDALAAFVDLPDDYAAQTADQANAGSGLGPVVENDPDPLITAPVYARWHSLTQRLLLDRSGNPVSPADNWVHELNVDPCHRTAAGFGTRVVQKYQEDYMNAAWQQIGDVLEGNRRIRAAQFAKEVAWMWYTRHLIPLRAANPERALVMTAPVHRHVVAKGFTVHHLKTLSLVTPAVTSAAMRRIVRPRGRLVRSLPFEGAIQPGNLLGRINEGEVSAAPPKTTPPGLPAVDRAADGLLPKNAPDAVIDWLRQYPWLPYLTLAIAALIFLLLVIVLPGGLSIAFGIGATAALLYVFRLLRGWLQGVRLSDSLREENQTPESVDALPKSPDFTLSQPGAGVVPSTGATDSLEATRFKSALREWYALAGAAKATAAETPPASLALADLTAATVAAINPDLAIPRRTLQTMRIPSRLRPFLTEFFQEVMAYPQIDLPMYEPLTKLSAELFLPNINLIEQNSITLLETNQKFIEAYLVGLNHEFARELLWREYPTDQRGSYFRQFWDVRGFLSSGNETDDELKEKLRDIPELHLWPRSSKLGEHDHREVPGETGEEVVLVIRGELLKKYPTAVIYAHRAAWQLKPDGTIDPGKERVLVDLTPAEEDKPPHDKLRTPLYEAKVDPDIYFFGFDLTVEESKGGTGQNSADPPGWFFVIKERPGEPRFGFDMKRDGPIHTFNDIAWDDAVPGGAPGAYIPAASLTGVVLATPSPATDSEKIPQHGDDMKVNVAAANAARWAYILYQAPVMVAVHAAEMLTKT